MAPALERRRSARKSNGNAHCPLKVTRVSATTDDEPKNAAQGNKQNKANLVQHFPFHPQGALNPPRTMDLLYFISPEKLWLNMTRYKSFVREYSSNVSASM
jgi:transposase InsO family protein